MIFPLAINNEIGLFSQWRIFRKKSYIARRTCASSYHIDSKPGNTSYWGGLGCVRRREEQIGVAATRLNTTEQRVDAVVPHQPQTIAG